MIKVEEIKLDILVPDDGIGMVIMQPFVELTTTAPFHWEGESKNRQIERILRTLEIAVKNYHGCERTHFTFFPEYSIPGLDGIGAIESQLKAWQNETIVIAGIDGLTEDDYSKLCSNCKIETNFHSRNGPDKIPKGQWINCCVTWVKDKNGKLSRWIQPKIIPAMPERHCPASNMYRGRSIYIFKAEISIQETILPFRFLNFICKDWIGNIGGSRLTDIVLREFDKKREKGADPMDIHLTVVLGRNNEPDYPTFLQSIGSFINESSYPGIQRSKSAILFVNNAGKEKPGFCTEYGKTGFVYHPNCSIVSYKKHCPPTYTLKERAEIKGCREARFREDGACIFSFEFIPPIPTILRREQPSTSIPLDTAHIYPINNIQNENENDPRTPETEVPAIVKWFNDNLDHVESILENKNHPLKNGIKSKHIQISNEIRWKNYKLLCRFIEISSSKISKNTDKLIVGKHLEHNVDNWDDDEKKSLEIVLKSLSMMKLCYGKQLEVKGSHAHGAIKNKENRIEILIVNGEDHIKCFKHAKGHINSGNRSWIVITQDKEDLLLGGKRNRSIYNEKSNPSDDTNITNLELNSYHVGYPDLKNALNGSENLIDFRAKVSQLITDY